jgi:Rad3-related DNA helicase
LQLLANTETDVDDADLVRYRREFGSVLAYTETIETLAQLDEEAVVAWCEPTSGEEVSLVAAPASVGNLLSERLYPRFEGVVLTSATLDAEDDFAWAARRIGLTGGHGLNV